MPWTCCSVQNSVSVLAGRLISILGESKMKGKAHRGKILSQRCRCQPSQQMQGGGRDIAGINDIDWLAEKTIVKIECI